MLLGELIADTGSLPDHWSLDTMSMTQLAWLAFWRRKRDQKQMRGLGEMLGVIWSADTYKRTDPTKTNKRVQEAFIPLAALINGEQLYKTLDKILDVNVSTQNEDPNKMDMSQLSVDAYRKLFEEALDKQLPTGGILPSTQKPVIDAPKHDMPKVPQTDSQDAVVQATPSTRPVLDLERIRQADPEMARHLEEDAAW